MKEQFWEKGCNWSGCSRVWRDPSGFDSQHQPKLHVWGWQSSRWQQSCYLHAPNVPRRARGCGVLHCSLLVHELKYVTTPFGWKVQAKAWLPHLFFIFRENIFLRLTLHASCESLSQTFVQYILQHSGRSEWLFSTCKKTEKCFLFYAIKSSERAEVLKRMRLHLY